MSIRVHGSPVLHRLATIDGDDRRLGWTACGLRFAWGPLPAGRRRSGACAECWA